MVKCTVPLFQQRTPSWRVRRSEVVTTTGDSHEMEQEVCYQKFAVEEIFQQFLRTLVPKYEWSMDSIKCNGYMCCSRMWNVYLCTKICIFIRIYVRKLPVCSLACCELAQCSLLASLIVYVGFLRFFKVFLILKKTTITAAAATEVGMAYRDIYSKTGYFLLHTITAPQYQPRLEIKSSIFGTTEEEEEGCRGVLDGGKGSRDKIESVQ